MRRIISIILSIIITAWTIIIPPCIGKLCWVIFLPSLSITPILAFLIYYGIGVVVIIVGFIIAYLSTEIYDGME